MRPLLPWLGLLAVGCGPVTRIGDKIIGLTNPVLVSGVVLGSKSPADPQLRTALELAGFSGFTDARLVVADALEFQDIEQALITDATLTITPDGGEPFDFVLTEEGWYRPDPGLRAPYNPGRHWSLSADLTDRVLPGTVHIPLPEAAELDVPQVIEAGESLTIDLQGQGFDDTLVTVYSWEGEEVFSNAPATNAAILDRVLPSRDPVERVEIPGDVFQRDDLYVVAAAGLRRAPDEGVDGLNEALTSILAGRIQAFPMIIGSPVAAGAIVIDTPPPPAPFTTFFDDFDTFGPGLTVELYAANLLLAGEPLLAANIQADDDILTELGDGRYRLEGAPSPDAPVRITLSARSLDEPGRFSAALPPGISPEMPATHTPQSPLFLPTPGGPWRAVLAAVVGPDGLTWTNVPDSAAQWEAITRSDASMERVFISPAAFPTPGTYGVALVGLLDRPEGITGLNTRFSTLMTGTTSITPIVVSP